MITQHFINMADRLAILVGLAVDDGDDYLPMICLTCLTLGNEDILADTPVIGDDKTDTAIHVVMAQDRMIITLQYFDDATF